MTSAQINAYQCRIDFDITALPITVNALEQLAHTLNAKIKTYQEAAAEIDKYNLTYMTKLDGFTISTKSGGYIIYRKDGMGTNSKIKLYCHEIAHIYSKHLETCPLGMSGNVDDEQESEAEEFARHFFGTALHIAPVKMQ